MVLSFEEIKKITVGAPFSEETSEGMRFYKYRPELFDKWAAHGNELGQRMLTTSGIRLDFHTNSQRMSVEIAKRCKFEIYVNGLLRYTMRDCESLNVALDGVFGETLEEAHITIYFPSHSIGVLKTLELDDGTYVRPHEFDRRILFIGDSITQGWESKFDSLSFANRVSRYFNADSVIQGIGGACFYEDCIEDIPFDPQWVIIAYGTNDFRKCKDLEEFKSHLYPSMAKFSEFYKGKKVFVISPIWREDQTPKHDLGFAETRAEIISEAKKYGFTHIDGGTLMPPIPLLFTDGLHPNDNGFSVYAENLISAIKKEIQN